MIGYPELMRKERVPIPTRCIICSTDSAIARMPVPRAATEGMRQSACSLSVKLRAWRSTYRSKREKGILKFPRADVTVVDFSLIKNLAQAAAQVSLLNGSQNFLRGEQIARRF